VCLSSCGRHQLAGSQGGVGSTALGKMWELQSGIPHAGILHLQRWMCIAFNLV